VTKEETECVETDWMGQENDEHGRVEWRCGGIGGRR
jgi:hypothetical protein